MKGRRGFPPGYTPWNKLSHLPEKQCESCGHIFAGHPCKLKTKKYCSQECFRRAKKLHKPKHAKVCPICGKEFIVMAGKTKRIYCSQACFYKRIISSYTRYQQGNGLRGKEFSKEHREKISQALRGRDFSSATKAKMSEARKCLFQDPGFLKMLHHSLGKRPNRPESNLLSLLNCLYPGEWKYTGDFSFIINGKNPDFVNVNGKKLLIELFGNYWHRGQRPEDRRAVFSPFGYKTLIIWESELKNIPAISEKIRDFAEEGYTNV